MAKALKDNRLPDGHPLHSDRSSMLREELEAIQKRAYFSQEGLTLLKEDFKGGDSHRIFKGEGLSRKALVKIEAIRRADELEAAVVAEREERIRALNKSKESLARRKDSVGSRKSTDQAKLHNSSMALNNSSEAAANFSEVEEVDEHKKSHIQKSSLQKQHKNKAEEALGLMPSKDTFKLIFSKATTSYRTDIFLQTVRDITKSLLKSFEASMGETIFFDGNTINLIAEICGSHQVKRLREELQDKSSILSIRTVNQLTSMGVQDEQLAKSSSLHILNGEITRLRIEKRTIFKSNCLFVPIVVSFGFAEEKAIGNFE